jgi:hypothetical protein
MLNAFSIHPDPTPKDEGVTDPIYGDSKNQADHDGLIGKLSGSLLAARHGQTAQLPCHY